MQRISLALCVVVLLCSAAFADDLNPPVWRGQPGSTFQLWEFYTPNPNPPADQVMNPYGPAVAQVQPGIGQAWWAVWGGREGVWPLSGNIIVPLWNSPVENPYKDIWIQLTWAQQVVNVFPFVSANNVTGTEVARVALGPTGEPYGDGTWWHSTYHVRLYPNPPFETILIDGAIMVDQLVIDTICVPEPSSLLAFSGSLAGLAGLAVRRRR